MSNAGFWTVWGAVATAVHLAGAAHAVHALFQARTPQGAVAWALSLATVPWVALPAYWVFGRDTFTGHVESRRADGRATAGLAEAGRRALEPWRSELPDDLAFLQRAVEPLTGLPCTSGNRAELLIDGEATFGAMLAAVEAAEAYVLVQFFIVADGHLARRFERSLAAAARRGVRVHFLYDEVGSSKLSRRYLDSLRDAGIRVASYRAIRRGPGHQLQLNFRNHRKVTVVDGRVAFVGGLNLADEYVGRHARLSPWRDTHVRVEGPAVLGIQLAFAKDWYWASRDWPELAWQGAASRPGQRVMAVPTGPADEVKSCQLLLLALLNGARRRLWIASPYFVPDPAVVAALQLAAVRGVDVRILLPENPDHRVVQLAAFSYYREMLEVGVRLYRYQPGFMHQKVVLVDDRVAGIGSVNLDYRSMHLNFEFTVLVAEAEFAARVAEMLERDLAQSREASLEDVDGRGLGFRARVRLARLLAPVL